MSFRAMRAALLLTLALMSQALAAPFDDLMQKLPDGANVLVLVNVEQILASPFAREHDAKKRLNEAFEERSLLIPPNAARFVLAGAIDVERRKRTWEAAAIQMKSPVDLEKVAKQSHRHLEHLSGAAAMGTELAFVLDLGGKDIGLLAPSNRQQAARWAQRLHKVERPLPEYLLKAGSYGDTAGTDIILAMDLADLLPEKFVAAQLRSSGVFSGRPADVDRAAAILSGARGARLGIKIGAKCRGKLVVDLSEAPGPLTDVVKPVILHAMSGAGVTLDELADWKPSVGEKSISLEGDLSDDGLRLVMSVVEVPKPAVALVDPQVDPGVKVSVQPAKESDKAAASQAYFKSLERELNSLRLQKRESKTHGQLAAWISAAARRVDRLPTLHVDAELSDFGGKVANQLRDMTAAWQGVGIESGRQTAGIWDTGSYYYSNSYTDTTVGDLARQQVRAEQTATGATTSNNISQQIANQMGAMRRKMTDRYQVEF